eukprot:295030-Chlamydomonas_euryale.AAC.2
MARMPVASGGVLSTRPNVSSSHNLTCTREHADVYVCVDTHACIQCMRRRHAGCMAHVDAPHPVRTVS